jgi:Mrp family chromosome partitioning ATPase
MERSAAQLQEALERRAANRSVEQSVDVRTQLARENPWESLRDLRLNGRTLAESRIVTAGRADPAHIAFDMVRTRVLQSLRQNGWTSVVITSPTPNCGKSMIALNLAFSFAKQQDCRTVLMDLDLRQPSIDQLLGMTDAPSMDSFLRGTLDLKDFLYRYENNLAIGANKRPVESPAEVLQSLSAAKAVSEMKQTLGADVILYDMTSMLSRDDVTAFLPNTDCAILVAEAERSTREEIDACERELAERTNLLGVVLNKCRYSQRF